MSVMEAMVQSKVEAPLMVAPAICRVCHEVRLTINADCGHQVCIPCTRGDGREQGEVRVCASCLDPHRH